MTLPTNRRESVALELYRSLLGPNRGMLSMLCMLWSSHKRTGYSFEQVNVHQVTAGNCMLSVLG